MLQNYITEYVKAAINKDQKKQQKIESDLRKLGMDRTTLIVLAREEYQRMKGEHHEI